MMSNRKPYVLLLISFLVSALFGASYFYSHGFRPHKIVRKQEKLLFDENCFTDQDKALACEIFNEKLRYLDKGCQAYVFETANKKYVVKFIRFSKYRFPFWSYFKNILNSALKDYLRHLTNMKNTDFNSYKIAVEKLKNQSQIIYASSFSFSLEDRYISLRGAYGKTDQVNIKDTVWIIQKRCRSLEQKLDEIAKRGDYKALEKISRQVISTIAGMLKRNIVCVDTNILKNYGYDNQQIILMDIGSFQNFFYSAKKEFQAQLQKSSFKFKTRIKKHFPDFIPTYDRIEDEEIEKSWR